jgi:hypothetical protein
MTQTRGLFIGEGIALRGFIRDIKGSVTMAFSP